MAKRHLVPTAPLSLDQRHSATRKYPGLTRLSPTAPPQAPADHVQMSSALRLNQPHR